MILDRFGREIASGKKPILDEIAIQSVRDRYASYPSQGLTPERLTRIFKEADQGEITRQAEMFEEMEEKDLHLGGVLQTRRLAVAGLDWEILPASDSAEDKKIAEAAREMIEYIEDWGEVLLDALDAVGKGFSVQEIMWELAEGSYWVKTCEWVHQKRFTFNSPGAILKLPKLLTDDAPVWGEDLPPNKFIVHMSKARSGLPSRGGLLRPCAWAYLFKNFDVKYWLVFLELFSVPMRVGKYKPGAAQSEIDVLKAAVFNLGVDAAAVISESTMIEILEAKGKGSSSGTASFGEFAEFWDKAISKGVLGHTGSTEGTPGKLGSEDQAKEVRQDLLESDAKTLMKTIKFQLLKPWVIVNYGPDAGIPKFQLHYAEGEDLEKAAKVYGTLVKDVNFEGIPEDHIHEKFGIPKPTGQQKTVKAAQQSLLTESPPLQQNRAVLVMKNTAGVDEPDWVATYMSRLAPSLASARVTALDAIEEWLRSLAGPPAEEIFVEHIQGILGDAYRLVDAQAITDIVGDVYRAYRAQPGIGLAFGGPDIRAINFLSRLDRFYVSKWYRNPDAQAAVRSFLQERYAAQGANLFGRGTGADYQAFRDLLGQKMTDIADWQVRRIVDTGVQRTRNWATVAQYEEAGITELEIYEPTKDCEFCVAMNGRVISVSTAYAKMTEQAAMTSAQYEADIARIAPTVENADAVVNAGMLPPYHPHCHGMVLRRMR